MTSELSQEDWDRIRLDAALGGISRNKARRLYQREKSLRDWRAKTGIVVPVEGELVLPPAALDSGTP
ncbi:hypothetical protein [Rhodococcus sp. BS-15]|uniref:hypothetical protein n=1 Tax=Rhodococcus sp. BS-15 TaxID=1304954 RepID=UPI000A4D6DFF|nr:hypothetical protein [Rhodococcus sp. BS-15]